MADALHTQVDNIRRSLRADGHCCRGNRTGVEWFTQQPCWGNDAPASQATNYRSSGTGFRLARPRNAIRMELANTGVAVSVNMSTTQSTSLSLWQPWQPANLPAPSYTNSQPTSPTNHPARQPVGKPSSPTTTQSVTLSNPSSRHYDTQSSYPQAYQPNNSSIPLSTRCPVRPPPPPIPQSIYPPALPMLQPPALPNTQSPNPPNRQSASPTKPPIPQPPKPSIRQP